MPREILCGVAYKSHAAVPPIGTACNMAPAEVRARLVMLESMRLVAGRQDLDSKAPRRVYAVTGEGRRRAGISDGRSKA